MQLFPDTFVSLNIILKLIHMYQGGKNGSGTYQTIINYIPKHDVYFELFAGSAGIRRKLGDTRYSFLIEKSQSQYQSLLTISSDKISVIDGDSIASFDIISAFSTMLELFGIVPFWYIDPPYLFSTRSSKKKMYDCELDIPNHNKLITGISGLKFPIMISAYRNELYDKVLKNWFRHDFMSTTRTGSKLESIYMNYPKPSELHDYSYIGKDFREREKFSLIRNNFISKFKKMPKYLQNSIISSLFCE